MMYGTILFSILMLVAPFKLHAKTITVGSLIKPIIKDPSELTYLEEWELAGAIHETLFEYQDGEGLSPSLAKSWKIGNDSIEIEIYPDRKFSNGKIIQAEDVAFSLNRTMAMDRNRSTSISECFTNKSKIDFENTSQRVFLKNFTCPKRILKDMAEVNYAILEKTKNTEKTRFGSYSGLFIPIESTDSSVTLSLNKFSSRIPIGFKENIELKIQYIEKPLSELKLASLDLIRLDEDWPTDNFKYAKFSIPVSVWYLTINSSKKEINTKALISYLRSLWINAKPIWNRTETKVAHLFPDDFGCKDRQPEVTSVSKGLKVHYKIVSHPSQETKNIEALIASVIPNKVFSNSSEEQSDVSIKINRQFLSADPGVVLATALLDLDKFSGNPGMVKKELERLQNRDQKPPISKLCELSDKLELVPIIAKKYLFLYNNPQLGKIFFLSSGNISYSRIFYDQRK